VLLQELKIASTSLMIVKLVLNVILLLSTSTLNALNAELINAECVTQTLIVLSVSLLKTLKLLKTMMDNLSVTGRLESKTVIK